MEKCSKKDVVRLSGQLWKDKKRAVPLGSNGHIPKYLIKEIEKSGIEEMRQKKNKTKKTSRVDLKSLFFQHQIREMLYKEKNWNMYGSV